MGRKILTIILCWLFLACHNSGGKSQTVQQSGQNGAQPASLTSSQPKHNSAKVIHVVVALCDNQYQGIVPVPPLIGNGDDPARNLYWGAAFGVKSFFKKAQDWKLVADTENPKDKILERVVFKHKTKDVYLIADAYRGREIKQGTSDFLNFASGNGTEEISVTDNSDTRAIYSGGSADVIAYVGHDGLMDFQLSSYPQKSFDGVRSAIILACISKRFFGWPLQRTGAKPLLWTTGLMAPESYVLKAAIDGWILNEDDQKIRLRAAEAYNAYQKCGLKAALNLFSTGW